MEDKPIKVTEVLAVASDLKDVEGSERPDDETDFIKNNAIASMNVKAKKNDSDPDSE